jgi:hypothetical protein
MRIINKIIGSHRRVEVQGLASGTEVVVHLWDGIKLVVEQASTTGELAVCVDWGESEKPIPVYDGHGNEVAVLSPPEEGDLNVE